VVWARGILGCGEKNGRKAPERKTGKQAAVGRGGKGHERAEGGSEGETGEIGSVKGEKFWGEKKSCLRPAGKD